jgi:hypothetical protein
MYHDFFAAVEAAMQGAPSVVAQAGNSWFLYNPTGDVADPFPHVLVAADGTLTPLNLGGTQVLCALAMTGGNA